MTKVELFEVIRREVLVHGKSRREVAGELGIHRRMVRQALEGAVPPARKQPLRSRPVFTDAARGEVERWLRADRDAPRKQRHTARRIFRRLQQELGFTGSESTVRRFVGRRRRELGLAAEAFVPLVHLPGAEAEVDWYEAEVDFPWGRETVQVFHMRACCSGREFHLAFPRQTQQAFLEGHVAAFEYFGGVFERVRYDNLSSAVQRVLRGRRRDETERFVALRSQYLFDSEFCRPGKEGAHEKGGVEGGGGRFRRSHLVPVPQVDGYSSLNRMLRDRCAEDDRRCLEGRTATVLEDWATERGALRALPGEALPTAETGTARVDAKGCVSVKTNRYSVPIRLAHLRVEFRLHALEVELLHDGRVVARHPRLQGRYGLRVVLDHYLELLWHKPGALSRSLPLQQARDRGEWPAAYDRLWTGLRERFEEASAAQHLLAVLMLHREFSSDEVLVAVELAQEHGSFDAGAISMLVRHLHADEPVAAPLPGLGALSRYDRPKGGLMEYDMLLTQRCTTTAVH